MKTILLAFTWTFVTCLFPIGTLKILNDSLFILILAQRFIFLLLLCIMFEQKDLITDHLKGLNSLATAMNPYSLKIFTITLFVIWAVLNFAYPSVGLSIGYAWSRELLVMVVFIVYIISNHLKQNWFYYFVVDGMMILSAFLCILTTD